MKKFLLAIVLLFCMISPALAAWVCTETVTSDGNAVVVSVACVGDGAAEDYALSTGALMFKWLCTVEVEPGSGGVQPNAAFDLDVEDADAFHLVDTDANSNTAKTWNLGKASLTQYPIIRGVTTLSFADIGDADDEVTVHLYGSKVPCN